MDVNESVGIINTLFVHDIIGSAVIVAVILIILISLIAMKYRQSQLEYGVVFTIPMIILLSEANYIPPWIAGVLVIICAFIMGVAMFKFFKP